jgi:ubiquinone/menaquinone biosynthesis C-methylase UbiE
MTKPRVKETDEGIQNPFDVDLYDRMMRRLRDRGWMTTKEILNAGIIEGNVLEVGPGPGYLGLEWLKHARHAHLTGLDISHAMIKIAEKNAREYGLQDRVIYVKSNAIEMPFENDTFDGVFSNGSLHEWADPEMVFSEINRVLKPGGKYCVTDLRRDMNLFLKLFLKLAARPRVMRSGLMSSIHAAYVKDEIKDLLKKTTLNHCMIKKSPIGLCITGAKRIN